MKYYGELRHIETQIAMRRSEMFDDASEARKEIERVANKLQFNEPKEDAPDELYYIDETGAWGLYYCCK